MEENPDDAWAYPAVTRIGNRAIITYFNYKGGLSLKLKSLPSGTIFQYRLARAILIGSHSQRSSPFLNNKVFPVTFNI